VYLQKSVNKKEAGTKEERKRKDNDRPPGPCFERILLASFDQRASSFAFFSMDTSRCTHNITLEKNFTSKLYAKKP